LLIGYENDTSEISWYQYSLLTGLCHQLGYKTINGTLKDSKSQALQSSDHVCWGHKIGSAWHFILYDLE
jgi:hypothetical protein